jgi:hypothetical protein
VQLGYPNIGGKINLFFKVKEITKKLSKKNFRSQETLSLK